MHVAIIGGGFSGLLAAYLLEKKNIQVTLFEKEQHLGGHLRTLYCQGLNVEIGTAAAFTPQLKELLLELSISYSERFTYRSFLDEHYQKVEQLNHKEVEKLLEELPRYETLYNTHFAEESSLFYGKLQDLSLPLSEYLDLHNLPMMKQVIKPHLSAYGFGAVDEVPAYYALHTFDPLTLKALIRGDKLLFIDQGMSVLVEKLSSSLKDIRYGVEVVGIEPAHEGIRIETEYATEIFDRAILTSTLQKQVLKEPLYHELMDKMVTNPFVTCTFEVENRTVVTTYYKANAGKKGCVQFFNVYKDKDKTLLVAYAYGSLNKALIGQVTEDLTRAGIRIKHLIMAKEWEIFPHLHSEDLQEEFYLKISEHLKKSPLCLAGTLTTKPSISHLYESIKTFIDERFPHYSS